jgi:hypothetical protein
MFVELWSFWDSQARGFADALEVSPMRNSSIYVLLLFLMSCPVLRAQDSPPSIGVGSVPPHIEIGPIISSAKQVTFGNYYHVGGGGRVTVNFNRFVAAEAESPRQPTGSAYEGDEVHTSFAAKVTYRKEEARWLKFAGLNFFGVAGPGFLNRTAFVAPSPPPVNCIPVNCATVA